ncbi:MAG: energy transducer TonB [Robiginitomaculum sp.]|nr:energy transducer TonB [Robiginitomaculum sp.]
MSKTINRFITLVIALGIASCTSSEPMKLNHDYPAPPSIKRLTEAGACPGGEALSAVSLPLPKFPWRAKRQSRQGWVVVSLDVNTDGTTSNVFIRKSVPRSVFDRTSIKAVENWRFAPPGAKPLSNCLVFISYRLGKVTIGQ